MKNLKETLKVSFVALSVSLLISTGAGASREVENKDLENEFSQKYSYNNQYEDKKLKVKAKLGIASTETSRIKDIDDIEIENVRYNENQIKNEKEDLDKFKSSEILEIKSRNDKQLDKSIEKNNKENKPSSIENNVNEVKNSTTEEVIKDTNLSETDTQAVKDAEVLGLSSSKRVLPNRISGKNRYEVAAKVSKEQFTNAKKVIVVNDEKYADALSATTLSDGKIPILYTQKSNLPLVTKNEIIRLNPVEIYLLGGINSINSNVESILKNYTDKLTRIAGRDRYETSAKVASMSNKKNVVVVSGENFSDPLVASSYAYSNKAKIVLTNSKSVSKYTKDYLNKNKKNIGSVTVVGGEKSVSKTALNSLKSITGKNVSRIFGRDRYDSAVKVANLLGKKNIMIANGETFADALSISPLAQKLNAPILLTPSNKLPTSVIAYLNNNRNDVENIFIIGGYKSVSENVSITAKNTVNKLKNNSDTNNKKNDSEKPIEENKVINLHDFVVAKNPTNLYKEAKDGSKSIRNVSTISVMQVTSILNDGWVQLDFNGLKGYAKASEFGMFNPNQYRPVYQQGMDVSKYNGNIDMKLAKKNGIDFAIIKAGSGASGEDPYFKTNYKKAKEAGINVGAYWYSYALNLEEAKEEAVRFLKILGNYQFEYPVYLDFEDPSQSKLSVKDRTDMAIAFMEILENKGYYTGLYSSGYWINNKFDTERIKDYDIWIAHWHVTKPNCYTDDYGMWQFTNKSKIKGVPNTGEGGVDMNYSYKNYPSIIKRLHLNNF